MTKLKALFPSACEEPGVEFASPRFPFLRDPQYRKIQQRKNFFAAKGISSPFFIPHDGVNRGTTSIAGRQLINFASYNYLGLSGSAAVSACAKDAIDRFGTSVSASRLVSGEISLHRTLEQKLARFIGVQDCMLYVGGHATNVSTIGHLFGPKDLILHDAQIHNSALEGCKLSGARRMAFRHNDCEHLDQLLAAFRPQHQRVLIIIEGVYSMEGDIADLPRCIALKKRHGAMLMVDEAHSIGVLGQHGRGIGEHFNINPHDVDLWMGTLSKSLASCGGYIAGAHELIDYLKYSSPGFVYSVGLPPSNAAAAIAALNAIEEDPCCVQTLRDRSRLFLEYAKARGLNTGLSDGTPIVPVMTGDATLAMHMSSELSQHGIHVLPIIHPAVPHNAARLRFFIAADHTEVQIRYAVERTAEVFFQAKAA